MECAKKDSDIIIREERDGTFGEWSGKREKKSDAHSRDEFGGYEAAGTENL